MILPPFKQVAVAKLAVLGSKEGTIALKDVPFNCGEPPDMVTVAVPLAQLDVEVAVISGKY